MLALIFCSTLLAAGPETPSAEVRQAYREARSQAGRSSQDQVRLALWCEAHGLTSERLHHLALAVLSDPANVTARGLMGLVTYQGRWQRPNVVSEKLKEDSRLSATLAEYNDRRMKAAYDADGQWRMALWCEEKGLSEQEKAHLTAVIRLDPGRDGAWKKLGYRKHKDRWVTEAQLAAERAEAEARRQADRKWKPLLEKYRDDLKAGGKRAEAESALGALTDPRAVRSVWLVFASGGSDLQAVAVRLLGQIEGVPASRAVAYLALHGGSPEVRRAAVETLTHRDPREFLGPLVGLIRKPLKYEVRPLNGPESPGVLFIEGESYNLRRLYVQPRLPIQAGLPRMFTDDVPFDPWGSQIVSMAAGIPAAQAGAALGRAANHQGPAAGPGYANTLVFDATLAASRRDAEIGRALMQGQEQAMLVQRQLAEDVDAVEATNRAIRTVNAQVLPILKDVTGKDLGEDPEAWQRWRMDQAGYALRTSSTEKPTFDQVVQVPGVRACHSCFGAGTLVRTLEGLRPIESIRIGDQILGQDARSGSLGFRPVVAVFHNPPSPTMRVDLGGEPVVATGIHRFWKAGKGWVMARDLRPGDPVRTLGGFARVASVEPDRVQPVFNLEVAEGHSYFVGPLEALVHDNSLVEPTPEPFDAAPAAVAGRSN